MALASKVMTINDDETEPLPIVGDFNISVEYTAGTITLYRSRIPSPFNWQPVEVYTAATEKIGSSVGSEAGPFWWKAVGTGTPTTATVEISTLDLD